MISADGILTKRPLWARLGARGEIIDRRGQKAQGGQNGGKIRK